MTELIPQKEPSKAYAAGPRYGIEDMTVGGCLGLLTAILSYVLWSSPWLFLILPVSALMGYFSRRAIPNSKSGNPPNVLW